MTTLDEFDDGFSQDIVAYTYETARFLPTDNSKTDRQITDWSRRVSREEPSEDNWKQTEKMVHRIRNVTPLVRGPKDTDDALAFEYEYVTQNGNREEVLDVHDPRGADELIRCTPLIPADGSE